MGQGRYDCANGTSDLATWFIKKWYFVTKIVLTYYEKIVLVSEKNFWNSGLKAKNLPKKNETTRTIFLTVGKNNFGNKILLLSEMDEKIESGILGKSVCLRKRFMISLSTHLSAMMHMQVIYFQKIYDLIEHHVFVFRQFLKVRLLTCSRHRTLQIFEFQFSKSLFLLLKWDKKTFFYWSKIFFGPMINVFLPPFNK